jgi:hypothetical protein
MRWWVAKLAGAPSDSLPTPARASASPMIDDHTLMGMAADYLKRLG